MQKWIFTIFLTIALAPVWAQNDRKTSEEAIKKTINTFFEGMQKGDSALMMTTISDSTGLQTILINRKGETQVRYESVKSLIISVTKRPPELKSLEERIQFDAIHIDGNLAVAWTPYKFFLNGNFSHCGANSFTLARMKGEWRIINIIDTRRREGCV
ncbi:MAG: nuclear transport factor 2 family protein [Dinghuibacter sp.]|nr:nuclear transport factor 2 family protein [Dinghuibacter sp.]